MPDHPIVHIEFSSRDRAESARFYAGLFGWKIQDMPEMNYTTFDAPPGPGGGFASVDGETYKPGDVVVYVGTDDIEGMLARIAPLGGQVLTRKTEIPGVGWFAFFLDPTGNRVALYTPMPRPEA